MIIRNLNINDIDGLKPLLEKSLRADNLNLSPEEFNLQIQLQLNTIPYWLNETGHKIKVAWHEGYQKIVAYAVYGLNVEGLFIWAFSYEETRSGFKGAIRLSQLIDEYAKTTNKPYINAKVSCFDDKFLRVLDKIGYKKVSLNLRKEVI